MDVESGPFLTGSELSGDGGGPVRAGIVALAFVTVTVGVVAVADPTSVGLGSTAVVASVAVSLVLHAAMAILPWDRLWGTPRGAWILGSYLGILFALVVAATALADPPSGAMRWLLLVVSIVSGFTLPRLPHAALSGVALAAILGALASAGWPLSAVQVSTFVVIYAFVAVFTAVATELNRRAVSTAVALQDRSRRLAGLITRVADAGRDLTTVDVDAIFRVVVETTAQLGSDMVGLYVTTEQGLLAYSATHGIPDDISDRAFTPAEGLVGEVLAAGETVVVADYASYPNAMPEYVAQGLGSALGTPITTTDGVAGLLVLGRLAPEPYDPAEVHAIELLAAHAGRALEIAQHYDEQEASLERLRELDRLKQDFVATVSHELRTPLTIIGGLAETLDTRWAALAEDDRHGLVRRIRANAGSLDAIIAKLLDFARLERDELATRLEPFDATTLVRATAERLEPLVHPDRSLEVRVDEVTVRGDVRLVERVLENLIVNATRHTPPGSSISVAVEADGSTARFSVRDDGDGIPEQDLARLGERFYRGGDTNARPTRGLGLGLALSNEILRLHGTELNVASAPGDGAEFSFQLPVVRPAAERNSARSASG